jgi:hypothetical protein
MKEQLVSPSYAPSQKGYRERAGRAGQRLAEEILLLCTTANISPRARTRLSQIITKSVDWEYFLNLAVFHGITPLVNHQLVTNGFSPQVPQPYRDQLQHGYNSMVYRNLTLSRELANVLSTFSPQGIETICLKGTVLAEALYGNPALRMVADMDILVHPGDISKAGSLLAKLGYEQTMPDRPRNHPFHEEPYCKKASFPILLELHWDLDNRELVAFPEQEIWHRARQLQLEGVSTRVLSPEDNLLFMANHLPKHDFHLLKFLADVAELLRKHEQSLDWDYITGSARSWGIEPAVYYALRRAKELIGAPVPASSLEEMKPRTWRWWLLDFLVSQEVFVSPIRESRLRSETIALAHSLMMTRPRQMLAVLSSQRGGDKKGTWLRASFWIAWVFISGLGRYCARVVAKRRLLPTLHRRS